MVGLRTNGFVGFILIGKVLENGINAFTYYFVNISDLVNVVHHRIDFRKKNKTQTAFQMPKTATKRQRENHLKNLKPLLLPYHSSDVIDVKKLSPNNDFQSLQ